MGRGRPVRFSVAEEFPEAIRIELPKRRHSWYWTGRTACRVHDKAIRPVDRPRYFGGIILDGHWDLDADWDQIYWEP